MNPSMTGSFVDQGGETWYVVEGEGDPFFVTLASDSDLWAFVSTAGSLTAGRRDQGGAFFPYETVDKIHRRWEHTGPRTWILADLPGQRGPWEPFARRLDGSAGRRSVWKNLSGTRLRFREVHPSGRLAFEYEWSASSLGLVRTARLEAPSPVAVRVLDGLLNLLPPGITFEHQSTMSSLTDAYQWNEAAAGGRMGVFTLYAKIWDRAEPKESFEALTAWYTGLGAQTLTLLSDRQVPAFCRGEALESEPLTRGRKGAFLVNFAATVGPGGLGWDLVVDGPLGQAQAADLAQRLEAGGGTRAEVAAAVAANTAGVDELLAKADGFQTSGDPMAAAHHRANVLFNIMRGGVFLGTTLDRDDLVAFVARRNRALGESLGRAASAWPAQVDRSFALEVARATYGPQAERLVLEYLPLTFSRRHGDPSRPWNRFSIRVRDGAKRVVDYQGNWRDIFQNWEALVPSHPAFVGSMITAFLGAMTVDGYNPYRISRDGIDWEVPEPDNPWSNIGYWGDHQVVYLLRLLEAAQDRQPDLLAGFWDRALFSFADVPYRLKPYADQVAHPKSTIVFDHEAHLRARDRARTLGGDGLLVVQDGMPVLANLAEKLAIIVLAKAGSLVPGGGLWLNTQRPEWNDANNALVGNGLSVVTLASLRRLLVWLSRLPGADRSFDLARSTLEAVEAFGGLVRSTPLEAVHDPVARRAFVDRAGALLEAWRTTAYQGAPARVVARAPEGLLTALVRDLLPLVDATLTACRRTDGLYQSYNLGDFSVPGRLEVSTLYPMLEGQVALLSSGFLDLGASVSLLEALFASPLYTPARRSFLLYPDRQLPGFFERNRLDAAALGLPITARLLRAGRRDFLVTQLDGTVRFAPGLSNRHDLEAAGADLGADLAPLADAYDRLMRHREFTGRSGTMFGYEGLGCIYWHMVAKLLLAVQERVFEASDARAPELVALKRFYYRVREGLGYRKTPAEYGAFPADPYSHTPGEGGAQQPGMTGQVKEEILTRWGELGLRTRQGRIVFDPVLVDPAELVTGELTFTYAGVPCTWRSAPTTGLRVLTDAGWKSVGTEGVVWKGVKAAEAGIHFHRGESSKVPQRASRKDAAAP